MTTTMSLVFMTQFSTKMDSIVHSSEIMFMYTNLTRQMDMELATYGQSFMMNEIVFSWMNGAHKCNYGWNE
jgi:hypothetical protein